ncbi:hypothetical protein GCM10022278_37730 [Allohahella marinimesophila]|uniref:Uncharacterized protein n=1 Tax=Allohahella marinimesophila TaxID=1054972 RepID=A0ABP7Q6M9_9GAMM
MLQKHQFAKRLRVGDPELVSGENADFDIVAGEGASKIVPKEFQTSALNKCHSHVDSNGAIDGVAKPGENVICRRPVMSCQCTRPALARSSQAAPTQPELLN